MPVLPPDAAVRPIPSKDAYPLILFVHYAHRVPSISYAFGLFYDGALQGIITFGTPCSTPLRRGLAGPDMAGRVLELNRLCLVANRPNEASFLVSRALKLLPRPNIVISFADTAQGHRGTVYQAANALYLGLSAKRTDWKLRGKEHLHGVTVADEFRGRPNRAALMRAKYGDDLYLAPRPRKPRYAWLLGSHKEKKEMRAALRYPVQPYP